MYDLIQLNLSNSSLQKSIISKHLIKTQYIKWQESHSVCWFKIRIWEECHYVMGSAEGMDKNKGRDWPGWSEDPTASMASACTGTGQHSLWLMRARNQRILLTLSRTPFNRILWGVCWETQKFKVNFNIPYHTTAVSALTE